MGALDYDRWDIAALIQGEDQPRIYHFYRDRRPEAPMLGERASGGSATSRDERPAITAGETSYRWLQRTFPVRRKNLLANASVEETFLLDEYVDVCVELKRIDLLRERLKNQVRETIGEREGLTWPGGT
jgi:hypothetical protein